MRHVTLQGLLLLGLAFTLAGCGAQPEAGDRAAAAGTTGSSTSPAQPALPAGLDQGPRAGESGYDEAMAKAGESLFQAKGCSACHAFGKRVTGPDLAGVSMRRTAAWMEQQILHPDRMVKQDPTARALFAQFALQMPNQGLTADEARDVIEYFKHRDHEAREAQAAGKETH